jgi:hypothetical protein
VNLISVSYRAFLSCEYRSSSNSLWKYESY